MEVQRAETHVSHGISLGHHAAAKRGLLATETPTRSVR